MYRATMPEGMAEANYFYKNTSIYWDDVAMFIYHNEYKLGIRKMNRNDIIEIYTIRELVNLDKSYEKYLGNRE